MFRLVKEKCCDCVRRKRPSVLEVLPGLFHVSGVCDVPLHTHVVLLLSCNCNCSCKVFLSFSLNFTLCVVCSLYFYP